jgi:hypothetical protein
MALLKPGLVVFVLTPRHVISKAGIWTGDHRPHPVMILSLLGPFVKRNNEDNGNDQRHGEFGAPNDPASQAA